MLLHKGSFEYSNKSTNMIPRSSKSTKSSKGAGKSGDDEQNSHLTPPERSLSANTQASHTNDIENEPGVRSKKLDGEETESGPNSIALDNSNKAAKSTKSKESSKASDEDSKPLTTSHYVTIGNGKVPGEEPELDPRSIALDKSSKKAKSAKSKESSKASNMASKLKERKEKTKTDTNTQRPVPKAGTVIKTHTKTTNNRSVREVDTDVNQDDITLFEDTAIVATPDAGQSLHRDSSFRTPSRVVYHARPAPTSTCVSKKMTMHTASSKTSSAAPSPRLLAESHHEPILEQNPVSPVIDVDDVELAGYTPKKTKSSVLTTKKSSASGKKTETVKNSSVKASSGKSSSRPPVVKSESTKAKSVMSTKTSPPPTKHSKSSRSHQSLGDRAKEQSTRGAPSTGETKETTAKETTRSPKSKPEEAKSGVETSKSRSIVSGNTKAYQTSTKSVVQTKKEPVSEAGTVITARSKPPQKTKELTSKRKDTNEKSSTQSQCSKDEIFATPPPSLPPSDKSSSVFLQSLCNSTIPGGDCECGQGCSTKIKVQVSSGHKKGIRARAMSLKLFF